MLSSRPYLIRAIFDWLIDSELTPYLIVDTSVDGVNVPDEYTEGDRIVLNISPRASRGLIIDNDRIILTTRFSGKPFQLNFPPSAVLAIYAKENGRGMMFQDDDEETAMGGESDSLEPNFSSSLINQTRPLVEPKDVPETADKGRNQKTDNNKQPPPNSPPKKPVLKIIK